MPTKTLSNYVAGVRSKLTGQGSTGPIAEADIIEAVGDAVDQYSRDKPLEKLHVITGDGTNRYTLPTDWEDGFSNILYIEYPAGTNAEKFPSILHQDEVMIWEDNTSKKFQFTRRSLATSETAWVKYTVHHTLDSSTNTIQDHDYEAVVFLSTAFASLYAAGQLIKSRGNTPVDGAFPNFNTTSSAYKNFAQEMLKFYYKRLGIAADGRKGALRIFDVETLPIHGQGFLTGRG